MKQEVRAIGSFERDEVADAEPLVALRNDARNRHETSAVDEKASSTVKRRRAKRFARLT
jgi:hypothetical protein